MPATQLVKNDSVVRTNLLHEIVKTAKPLPKLIRKTYRIAARRKLPTPTFLTVFPFMVQWHEHCSGFTTARELGCATGQPPHPAATENRPAGPCVFLTAEGQLLVDQRSEQGSLPLLLQLADKTHVAETFSAHDLQQVLLKLRDFRMELTDYNLAHGFWEPMRRALDKLST